MNVILEYLVVIAAIFTFALASSLTRKGFSTSIFMVAVIVGINVLVWQDMLPLWTMVLSALMIVGILFTDGGDNEDE
jgi:hypothetical protein